MFSSNEKPIAIKSKRGRKALAVSEGYVDVTGKTHIITVRRLNPPASKRKFTISKSTKQCNNYCSRCGQNDEYVDILNDRNDRIGKHQKNFYSPHTVIPHLRGHISTKIHT